MVWIRKTETRKRTVIIGSRGSRLALIQAGTVLAELERAYPDIEFKLTKIVTRGDQARSLPISRSPVQGIFVKEIEESLLSGKIDLAVHSLKDMPTKIPPGLSLAAVTERLDPRDILVSNSGKLAELPSKSIIGTGSLRRMAQLLAYRHDLKVQPLRGNIDTRLQKVNSGKVDGIVIAAAGMIRLDLEAMITEYLPLELFLPAVGQGVLGIETREGDEKTVTLASSLNHEATWRSVRAERAFLHTLGGGCHAPIAALATTLGDTIRLQGLVASSDGSRMLRDAEEGSHLIPEEIGSQLAKRMLEIGASELIMEAAAK